MHSKIDLQTTPGEGSTFSFKLTVQSENEKKKKQVELKGIKSVLLVDDTANSRTAIGEILENAGIEVCEVENGFLALEKLTKRTILI